MEGYMNIDGYLFNRFGERAKLFSHEEKYSCIVEAIGLERLIPFLPASLEELRRAHYEDRYMNNIPYRMWEKEVTRVASLLSFIGINMLSETQVVCILKRAAIMYIGGWVRV